MKKHLLTLIWIMSINIANAQNVNIPDAIFKSRLVNNPAINTNGDGEIQVSEAAAYSGVINVSTTWPSPAINDLTGIEAFTALTGLDCSGNVLSSLNVSSNTALTSLICRINQLTNLNISTNTALTTLFCSDNALTSLDVSANMALTLLSCYNNQLTSLDVSANAALTALACSNNQLTSLDVSTNTALTSLDCGNNSITSLDVSANIALTSLDCRYSSITSLDVSTNAALVYLYCLNNQLTSLNVQNGNNVNFSMLNATNNPNLFCIQVDNVANANSYNGVTFIKDSTASYSTNCGVYCASSQGPDSGSVFVNVQTQSSTPWSNPQGAQSSDGIYASVSLGMGPSRSSRLQTTGFGFSIPATASICGIEVKVEKRCSNAGARDYEIRIVKNDTVTGANYGNGSAWSATDSVYTYGSNSDLWGTTWTPAEINDSSFGAAVSAFHIISAAAGAFVNQITIKVFYDNSTGIADNTAANEPITVFPNPSNGNFTITFPDIINKGTIEIYSAIGERIFSEPVSLTSKKEINLNNISRGVYFVKVYEGEKYYCKKIIIE